MLKSVERKGESNYMAPRTMEKVTTNFVKIGKVADPEKNVVTQVEGTLIEKGSMTFQKAGQNASDVGRYKLQQDEEDGGAIITVMGNVKIDDLMELIEVGTYVSLTYAGEIKTGNNQQMIDVELQVESASPAS